MRGIDIVLGEAVGHRRIRRTVRNAVTGSAARSARVLLAPCDRPYSATWTREAQLGDRFEFTYVIPGCYRLSAATEERDVVASEIVDVEVGAKDLDGIELTLQPGVDISTRMLIDNDKDSAIRRSLSLL